jgi:hypothetical protein
MGMMKARNLLRLPMLLVHGNSTNRLTAFYNRVSVETVNKYVHMVCLLPEISISESDSIHGEESRQIR